MLCSGRSRLVLGYFGLVVVGSVAGNFLLGFVRGYFMCAVVTFFAR